MAFYKLKLTAGVPYRQDTAGALILIDALIGTDAVDITLVSNGATQNQIPNRKAAFKYVARYDAVIFEAPTNCEVHVFLSFNEVHLGFADGAQVSVAGTVSVTNDVGNPVAVSVTGGVTLTASNVGISNNDAEAVPVRNQALGSIVDYAPAVIPGVMAISLVADATLRKLRFRNSHATAVIALGGASVSLDNSPIRLLPGEVFIEEDAAGASWWVISDTPGAQVQVQGLK